jgi:large subunit ribosomal protein L30e
MAKLLEKALIDAIKERKRVIGVKQIMSSMENSKLVVISRSLPTNLTKKIEESAKNHNVPLIHFNDNSITLGKLCGLTFRVSAISLNLLSNTNTQAILKEYETK